jgi:hypothetical protein
MAHNDQASDSRGGGGGGYTRTTKLNIDEAKILVDNNIIVPPAWHLPHGWHVSADGYTVAPILLEGPLLDENIEQRDLLECAPMRAV